VVEILPGTTAGRFVRFLVYIDFIQVLKAKKIGFAY
jgi:hypothetical protein